MAPHQVFSLAVANVCVFFLVCGVAVHAQEAEKGRIIRKIEIKGNKRIGTAAIKGAIRLREGDPYDPELVSQDVSSIWAMGYFDNVEVVLEDIEEGLKLTFLVTERPVITNIVFEGNEEVGDGKLRDVLEFRPRDYLKHYLVKLGEDRIKNLYLKEGFLFAKVDSKLRRFDGEVEVIYMIEEGPKATIKRVSFEGNKSISDKKLRKQIKTRRRRFPRILFKGIFDREKFDEDKERLREFYVDKGWLDVRVEGRLTYSRDKTDIFVTFVIDEGERYFVNRIAIKGNRLFSRAELLADMKLYTGGPFLPPVMEEDARHIRTLYGEQGYVNAKVVPRRIFSPVAARVDVVYEIDEGERLFIEEIKVRGNEKTKDNVIRRELLFLPGERFDTVKIRESHERLIATGYFEKQSPMPVNMLSEPGSRPDLANVIVEVKEGWTGLLRFGGGFGVNSGFFGDIAYTDKNFNILDLPKNMSDFWAGDAFRGSGHVFTIRLSPGLRRTEAIVSLHNPSVYDSVYSAGGSAFFFTRVREDYDEERRGGRFTVGRMLRPNLSVAVTPEFQDIEVQDVDSNAPQIVKDLLGSRKKLSLELRMVWDTRDRPVFPTRGHLVDGSIEGSGIDVDILRFTLTGKKYFKIFEPEWWGAHILNVGATLGMVGSTTDEPVPIFERFFAGGTGSIRGFDYRGVSPVDPATEEQIGGESLVLFGIEDTFPIYKNLLKGVAFIDTGKVDEDVNDIGIGNMRVTVGVGVRFTLPFFGRMNVGLDFGIPVVKDPDDDTKTISINVGGGGF